jgi:hypothetical protein
MMALGGLAVIQTVATILYFALMVLEMRRTGLGV